MKRLTIFNINGIGLDNIMIMDLDSIGARAASDVFSTKKKAFPKRGEGASVALG